MRVHQHPVHGQDRIAVQSLGEVQRGLRRAAVSHDEVGVGTFRRAQPGQCDLRRTGGEVFDLRSRGPRSGERSSLGVSDHVTTLKCDYRFGDVY